ADDGTGDLLLHDPGGLPPAHGAGAPAGRHDPRRALLRRHAGGAAALGLRLRDGGGRRVLRLRRLCGMGARHEGVLGGLVRREHLHDRELADALRAGGGPRPARGGVCREVPGGNSGRRVGGHARGPGRPCAGRRMTGIPLGFAGLATVVLLLVLRVPIGVALGGTAFAGIWILVGPGAALGMLAEVPYEFAAHWSLSSIPMFILMGYVAFYSKTT